MTSRLVPTRLASVLAVAAALAAPPAAAWEVANIDIVGLRLGMSEAQVVATLVHQGYQANRTTNAITATTRDGQLRIELSTRRGVTEITYVLFNQGAGAPAKINESVLAQFGNPDQATPPTWCRAVRRDGVCPQDQAMLTFLPSLLTIRLTAARDPGE
jgi:hypothetical protein